MSNKKNSAILFLEAYILLSFLRRSHAGRGRVLWEYSRLTSIETCAFYSRQTKTAWDLERRRRQYFLWDEIMKREIELYPKLILPVVKEIFRREYPEGGKVTLLSTEYTVSRIHERGEKLLHGIRSDLLLKIGRELYHFECQIEKDGKMVFRMLEYDVHIALTHGKGTEGKACGRRRGKRWGGS